MRIYRLHEKLALLRSLIYESIKDVETEYNLRVLVVIHFHEENFKVSVFEYGNSSEVHSIEFYNNGDFSIEINNECDVPENMVADIANIIANLELDFKESD